jgi:FKBP-type peptidyl-prolyl cis-trans isomerase FkpA
MERYSHGYGNILAKLRCARLRRLRPVRINAAHWLAQAILRPQFFSGKTMRIIPALLATAFAASTAVAAPADTETLPSGVTVQKLNSTDGPRPNASDQVRVHYRGTLENGTEFDSSYKRGQPAKFPLSRVIPCWTQGVQKLRVGEKATLICPPKTAYGEAGIPGTIPPNSTLHFDVELIGIEK